MARKRFYIGLGVTGIAVVLAATAAAALSTNALSTAPRLARAHQPRDATLVLIPAGEVTIGDDQGAPDERPAFRKRFDTFLLDRTPVTVAQFRTFVADTGYVTEAEQAGDAGVFDKTSGDWILVRGANWRQPQGAKAAAALPDHPVTQVTWRDATAFCAAYGARLPTEFEWERAARMGQTPDGHVFKTGDPLAIDGKYLANVWQGFFPLEDTGADGYRNTSPVGAFGETPAGLTDMAGNVWEWTASARVPYGVKLSRGGEPDDIHRVQRGGSFLCDTGLCEGFRVTARNHASPDTALMHVGFRCASDPGRTTALMGRRRLATL